MSRPALVTFADNKPRCGWLGDDPLYIDYHDREWGVPLRRRVSRIFSRGKASSQTKRGMRPVIPRISPAREPRNGTRSPPSRVTAMKSFVIAPLTSRPPTSEALPSSYPKALSIGSSAGFLFC